MLLVCPAPVSFPLPAVVRFQRRKDFRIPLHLCCRCPEIRAVLGPLSESVPPGGLCAAIGRNKAVPCCFFHGRRFCSDFPTVRISCGEALFLRKSGKNKAQIVRQPPMVWICRQICGTAIDPAIDCLPPGHTDGRPTEHTSPQTN